jgi:hypothetical protein
MSKTVASHQSDVAISSHDDARVGVADTVDSDILKHERVVDMFTAATLVPTPSVAVAETRALAFAEGITNSEWLHHRALSRVGIAEHESGGRRGFKGNDRGQAPLFAAPLGDGGDWDW